MIREIVNKKLECSFKDKTGRRAMKLAPLQGQPHTQIYTHTHHYHTVACLSWKADVPMRT